MGGAWAAARGAERRRARGQRAHLLEVAQVVAQREVDAELAERRLERKMRSKKDAFNGGDHAPREMQGWGRGQGETSYSPASASERFGLQR